MVHSAWIAQLVTIVPGVMKLNLVSPRSRVILVPITLMSAPAMYSTVGDVTLGMLVHRLVKTMPHMIVRRVSAFKCNSVISFVVKEGSHIQTMISSVYIRQRACKAPASFTLKIGSGLLTGPLTDINCIIIVSIGKPSLINYRNPDYNSPLIY